MLQKFLIIRACGDNLTRDTRFAVVCFGENYHDKTLLTQLIEYSGKGSSLFIAPWSVPVVEFIERVAGSFFYDGFLQFYTRHLPKLRASEVMDYFQLKDILFPTEGNFISY